MESNKQLNRYSLLLVPLGILINIGLAQLALLLKLPLFLDAIGTILVAALTGYLPGIMVGFFSNVFNGLSDPITLYYGIISILIAAAATFFSRRYVFTRFGRSLLASLGFAVIGGGLGSVLTWLLYGFSFGSGISAPFAVMLHESAAISEFAAQFTADMGIDIADKIVSVLAVFFILKLLPGRLLTHLPLGFVYQRDSHLDGGTHAARHTRPKPSYRKLSLKNKVLSMIVLTALVLGILSTGISYMLYRNIMNERYASSCSAAVNLMLQTIDADRVEGYLADGVETDDYVSTERALEEIRACMPDIEYMYMYQIREDGCHVVFDVDTPELPGGTLGDLVPHEDAFSDYLDELLAGREIQPVISNGAYGWLLTVYKPLRDSAGRCVAYAAADIAMDNVIIDRYVFIIRMATLLFGATILIVAIAVWYAESRLVTPINAMAAASSEFAYDSEEQRLKSTGRIRSLNIQTGDEIENLYHALAKTVTDVAAYITDINDKAKLIAQMQSNIIISFATMVENRDLNTGAHIKHTSAYVQVLAEELRRSHPQSETLSDEYIHKMVRSAPLHDIGKIRISDTILNKPGRLTPEEFEEIKTHTTAGRDILTGMTENINDTDYLSQATAMALYHHERWDGKGYPFGLAGEEIPLCARIMAVADVFDALVSRRSYKEPMPFATAKEIIVNEAGSHFDPAVVDAFCRVSGELEALIGG